MDSISKQTKKVFFYLGPDVPLLGVDGVLLVLPDGVLLAQPAGPLPVQVQAPGLLLRPERGLLLPPEALGLLQPGDNIGTVIKIFVQMQEFI